MIDNIEHHHMTMAWTCHGRHRRENGQWVWKWSYWENDFDMWQYMDGKSAAKAKVYVFAHNMFFDLQASSAFRHLHTLGWKLDFIYDKGIAYILTVSKGNRKLVFLSTTNFYPFSLRQLGDITGLEKLDVDFQNSDKETIKTYCRRDVEIIRSAMLKHIKFIDNHDLGNFKLTYASQSFAAYRHRFMRHKITLHREPDIVDLERRSYYGGRVECFRVGDIPDGPFKTYDINSMYPFVMTYNDFPTRLVDFHPSIDPGIFKDVMNHRLLIADCYINTNEPVYPMRQEDKIIFPIGSFKTTLTTPTIKYAYEHGHLIGVENVATYEYASLFADYVAFFYNMRLEAARNGDRYLVTLCKFYLNQLYGKFGQQRPVVDLTDAPDDLLYAREVIPDLVTGRQEIVTTMFGKQMTSWDLEEGPQSFCAIAAHVTDYARMHLWSLMKAAGLDKVLYIDTDSITIRECDSKGLAPYIDDTKLGMLKDEGTCSSLSLYGPKDYLKDGSRKLKGVPKGAEPINETTYRYMHFERQAYHLWRRNPDTVAVRNVIKRLERRYTKGVVGHDGMVSPHVLQLFVPEHVSRLDRS